MSAGLSTAIDFFTQRFYSFTGIHNLCIDFQQSHLFLQVPKGLVYSFRSLGKK